jgi:succinate dehydrogenase/fumarate reductase flavoprotein subunit
MSPPAEVDVLVLGFGAAGGSAAVEAHDAGARVLVALEPPPYAIETWPGLATASGGPRRDSRARVLAPGGAPSDGLYAAGAAGSVWGHLTEHGGGLTDAIVFGPIAGAQAARAV